MPKINLKREYELPFFNILIVQIKLIMFKTQIYFFLVFCFSFNTSFAQNNLVTVIASGEGSTESSATNRALRNAIEKTLGVFISSSTQVSNDELIKDEIATVASGNIASYEVISIANCGSTFIVSVSAKVSPERVVFNLKNSGQSVELQGNVYAQNVIKEKFYKEQEILAIKDFVEMYKNLWIIDSFSIYTCAPYFESIMPLGENQQVTHRLSDWGIGQRADGSYSRVLENTIMQNLYKNFCFEALMMDNDVSLNAKTGSELNGRSFYLPNILKLNEKGDFEQRPAQIIGNPINPTKDWNTFFYSDNDSRKNSMDVTGDFHILPIVFKPHYNVKNAVILSNAISNLLNAISIKDDQDYVNKMGRTYAISLVTVTNELLRIGSYTAVKSGANILKVPFYEMVGKVLVPKYSLRNSESIKLVTDFFDRQFTRSQINALKIVNPSFGFSKKIHFILENLYLKNKSTTPDIVPIPIRFNIEVPIDLSPITAREIVINNRAGNGYYALYPSILMLRLSLDDLQKLSEIKFVWKN